MYDLQHKQSCGSHNTTITTMTSDIVKLQLDKCFLLKKKKVLWSFPHFHSSLLSNNFDKT
jgi:hypothetical protein